MKVRNKEEAWFVISSLTDWDYEFDAKASSRAGHPIYC